jgi:predicted Zn-dependent peptidase
MRPTKLAAALIIAAVALPAGAAGDPPGVTLPPYEQFQLKNGLRVILMEKHDVPLIAFHLRIAGGEVADAAGKAGTSEILADLIQKGAGRRDGPAFSEAVDSVGGNLSAGTSREAILIRGEFLARDRALMLELLADMVIRPRLDAEEFEKIRQRSIEQIAAAKDSRPHALIREYFMAFLFDEHPYGRAGDETSFRSVGLEDAKAYVKREMGADRSALAVVGDFDTKSMKADLERAFGPWGKASGKPPRIKEVAGREGRRVLLVDKPDAAQTLFWIGSTGIARDDPDRAVLDVANTAFGGRFTSMLNTELRIKTGLSYGARSSLQRYRHGGVVAITSFTKTETTEEALDLALKTLADLRERGLSAETLASVQTYVAGQFPPRLETGDALAAKLTEIEFYGLDRSEVDDYLSRVAAADDAKVREVIERVYPSPDRLTFVLIGKADAIRDVAKKYGELTEMKISDETFRPGG